MTPAQRVRFSVPYTFLRREEYTAAWLCRLAPRFHTASNRTIDPVPTFCVKLLHYYFQFFHILANIFRSSLFSAP
jgi:hypothetical protein